MEMGIPRKSRENGNKTPSWEWECEGVEMYAGVNGNDPDSDGKSSHGFLLLYTCIRLFRHSTVKE